MKSIKRYTRKGYTVLRNEGVVSLGIKALQKVQKVQIQQGHSVIPKKRFTSLVDRENVMRADWSKGLAEASRKKAKSPYTVNWIMSPPGSGGGHQNIFRFIEHLDSLGYVNNVYLYSNFDDMTLAQARENVAAYCKASKLKFYRYGEHKMKEADALFATGWETAYPVFNEKTSAKKMYFVQDFEPYFYPMGTDYILAENTYKFGFHGITAGAFLADKLSTEYGMKCDHFDFAADEKVYRMTNTKKRKEVFFYARPVTERRGFDLGIMALELFHKQRPDYIINLAGWDVSDHDIPFPYVNHKTLSIEALPGLYNKCASALVMSLTNMSLLPPELLACGAIPVVNDGPNNRLVSDNPYIHYTDASPAALANAMVQVVDREDQMAYAKKASASVHGGGWQEAKEIVVGVLERELG